MGECFFMKCFPGFLYRLREGETMAARDVKDFCTGQVRFLLQTHSVLKNRITSLLQLINKSSSLNEGVDI